MAKLQITLTKSVIGRPETQRKTVKALGLVRSIHLLQLKTTQQFVDKLTK